MPDKNVSLLLAAKVFKRDLDGREKKNGENLEYSYTAVKRHPGILKCDKGCAKSTPTHKRCRLSEFGCFLYSPSVEERQKLFQM